MLGKVGENRPTSKVIVVEFPVTVTVEWPEGIPYSDEDAIDVAQCVVSQTCERNVGPTGKIVWAKCFSEVSDDDVQIVETRIVGPKSKECWHCKGSGIVGFHNGDDWSNEGVCGVCGGSGSVRAAGYDVLKVDEDEDRI